MTFFKSLLASVLVHCCIFSSVTLFNSGKKAEAGIEAQQWEVELTEPEVAVKKVRSKPNVVITKSFKILSVEKELTESKPESARENFGSSKEVKKGTENVSSTDAVILTAENLHPYFKKLRRIIFLRLNSMEEIDTGKSIHIKFSLSPDGAIKEVDIDEDTSKDSHQKIAHALVNLKDLGPIPPDFIRPGSSANLTIHLPVRF